MDRKLLRWAGERVALVCKSCLPRTADHRSSLLLIYVALFLLCMNIVFV